LVEIVNALQLKQRSVNINKPLRIYMVRKVADKGKKLQIFKKRRDEENRSQMLLHKEAKEVAAYVWDFGKATGICNGGIFP